MRYVEKRTFREIAKILGNITHAGVDVKCKAIKRRIEERFGDEQNA